MLSKVKPGYWIVHFGQRRPEAEEAGRGSSRSPWEK